MEKMTSRKKNTIQNRAFVVVGERVGIIRTSNTTHLFIALIVKSLRGAQPVAKSAQKANSEPRARSTRRKFHVVQDIRNSTTADRSQNFGGPQRDWSSKVLCM